MSLITGKRQYSDSLCVFIENSCMQEDPCVPTWVAQDHLQLLFCRSASSTTASKSVRPHRCLPSSCPAVHAQLQCHLLCDSS